MSSLFLRGAAPLHALTCLALGGGAGARLRCAGRRCRRRSHW
jgi:hypothetical protein